MSDQNLFPIFLPYLYFLALKRNSFELKNDSIDFKIY